MPEAMVETNLVENEWTLVDRQTSQFSEGGQPAVLIKGEPYWQVRLKYLFPRTARSAFMIQSAQFQRLQSGAVEIDLFRGSRMNPQGFDASGASVSGFSVNAGNETVTLNAGSNLDLGDMVAYDAATSGRFLGEIVEVVSRSGSSGTFKTRPRALGANGTPNAAVYKAAGSFRMLKGGLRILEPVGPGPMEIVAEFEQVSPYG
jgi:hypothetical protein